MTGEQWYKIYKAVCAKHGIYERDWNSTVPNATEPFSMFSIYDYDKAILNEVTALTGAHIEAEVTANLTAYIEDRRKKENPL